VSVDLFEEVVVRAKMVAREDARKVFELAHLLSGAAPKIEMGGKSSLPSTPVSTPTAVHPKKSPSSGSKRGQRNNDPAVLACMEAIRDWVRANTGYNGDSNDLSKMLAETGFKIGSDLARQIVSEAGLKWPDGYGWDRYRFEPRISNGGSRGGVVNLIDDPVVSRAYSALMDHFGLPTRKDTYHLTTQQVDGVVGKLYGYRWSKNQGYRRYQERKNNADYQDTHEEVSSTVEDDNGGFYNALTGKENLSGNSV